MNNYQRNNLKKFISNYIYLIRNKNFKEIYKILSEEYEKISLKEIYNGPLLYAFTEMMFDIGENPFEGVVTIPKFAGYELKIKKLILPKSVMIISKNAFANCKNLEEIEFTSVEYINEDAFFSCDNLKSIKLSKSIRKIDYGAFGGCTNLKDIYYEGKVKKWRDIRTTNLSIWIPYIKQLKCTLHCTDAELYWNNNRYEWEYKD